MASNASQTGAFHFPSRVLDGRPHPPTVVGHVLCNARNTPCARGLAYPHGLMLALLTPTDPLWVEAAAADLPALLSDHAHCEIKAAQSALSLVARYAGEMPSLVEPLSALAREEAEHFARVHERLRAQDRHLGMPASDQYVTRLIAAARQNRHDNGPALLDKLLVAALIEGRSCERFRLLSEHLPDAELREFYRELMVSEAHHFTLFSSLAAECFGPSESRARLSTLATREADIVKHLPLGPQVHG
jgi:tRNA-(ms[2]io[6]A)-hydroxylase